MGQWKAYSHKNRNNSSEQQPADKFKIVTNL